MSALANELYVATREFVPLSGKELINTFSQKTVLFSKLRKNKRDYEGGTSSEGEIRETIQYKPLPGGPHKRYTTFSNVATSTTQPIFFTIKFFEVTVVFNKVDIKVLNKGKDAIYSMLDEKLRLAADTLGRHMEILAYLPGSGASYNTNVGGLTEICNDGTNNSALGLTHSTYGGLSRADTEHGYAVKGKVTNINGALTHRALLKSLKDVDIDGEDASFGLTTPDAVVYVQDRFQPQQRFSGTTETDIGIPGWKFNTKTVFESRYVPGNWISAASATSGENRIAYDVVSRMSEQSGTALAAYPTITGETWFWVNAAPKYMSLWVSTDPEFNFGFSDFMGNVDNDQVVGRFRLACAITCKDNRRQAELNQIKV